jgi:hypothetical protein
MKRLTCLSVTAFATVALACGASRPPPTDHLATAIAATQGAQVAGAAQVPKAALQMQLAQEQIDQARQLIKSGKNERADYMTLRAYNDAQLAVALVREQEAKARLADAHQQAKQAGEASGASPAAQH